MLRFATREKSFRKSVMLSHHESAITFGGLAKVAIFSTNFHTKHKCLYNHKTVLRSTEPPLLPNRCYQLPFCLSEVLSCQVCTELLHCPRAMACTLFCFFWVGLCHGKKANVSAKVLAFVAVSFEFTLLLLRVFHCH